MSGVELARAFDVTGAAVLPDAQLATVYLHLGWSVLLGWLGRRCANTAVACLLAAWAWVPGIWGASHWLGLAFQSPSVLAVLWCANDWWAQQRGQRAPAPTACAARFAWGWSTALGWILLADILGWFPASVYAWGFSTAALACVALLAFVPLIAPRTCLSANASERRVWMLWPLALLVFVATRLPTGNVWDAVLDPWLWLVVQVVLLRRWRGAKLRPPCSAPGAQEHP